MEKLVFDGARGNKIVFAGDCAYANERAHLTTFCSDELAELGKQCGLEFHYEMHLGNQGNFVRLCCHIEPYNSFKNLNSKDEYIAALRQAGKDRQRRLRELLEQEFVGDSEFAASRYNYLGLLKRDICSDDYAKAVNECERFIEDTYQKAVDAIKKCMALV